MGLGAWIEPLPDKLYRRKPLNKFAKVKRQAKYVHTPFVLCTSKPKASDGRWPRTREQRATYCPTPG